MQYRCVRTAEGQAEIQSNARRLSRPLRNLLLIINATQPAGFWLTQVKGCTEADLQWMLAERLLATVDLPAPPPPAGAGGEPPPADAQALAVLRQIQQAGQRPLYEALNVFSKEALGLVRGYRFALEIERCDGPADLRVLAQRLLDQVRGDQGDAALTRFAALLAECTQRAPREPSRV